MKKNLILLLIAMLTIASCKTQEKIIYFQDTEPNSTVATQKAVALKLIAGDKIGINITSASTPELAMRYSLVQGTSSSASQANVNIYRYTLDENGNIDLPGIGRLKVSGLTRSEAAALIQEKYREGIINDAIVTVASYNQYVTILGEVKTPGQYEITRDNLNILEAIGRAGDLTITGRRDRVKVIRQEKDGNKTYFVDLRSKDIFNSPVYNLQQNDVVYVEPNKMRTGQSTYNDNSIRSISTWLSISSVLISLSILIFRN